MNPSLEYFQAYWWSVEEAMRLPSQKPQNATFAKMMARQIGRPSFLMDPIKIDSRFSFGLPSTSSAPETT
jgi:hypothetical protein